MRGHSVETESDHFRASYVCPGEQILLINRLLDRGIKRVRGNPPKWRT